MVQVLRSLSNLFMRFDEGVKVTKDITITFQSLYEIYRWLFLSIQSKWLSNLFMRFKNFFIAYFSFQTFQSLYEILKYIVLPLTSYVFPISLWDFLIASMRSGLALFFPISLWDFLHLPKELLLWKSFQSLYEIWGQEIYDNDQERTFQSLYEIWCGGSV